MKSNKVFAQRLNQEFKRLYPTRKIFARKIGSAISIYTIKRTKGWFCTRDRKISMGQVSMFCFYETHLNTKNKKIKLLIDDVAYEYFGEGLAWMDDDEYLAADKRYKKRHKRRMMIMKPDGKIAIRESDDFDIKGAL